MILVYLSNGPNTVQFKSSHSERSIIFLTFNGLKETFIQQFNLSTYTPSFLQHDGKFNLIVLF